jgi:hypothetical protein
MGYAISHCDPDLQPEAGRPRKNPLDEPFGVMLHAAMVNCSCHDAM